VSRTGGAPDNSVFPLPAGDNEVRLLYENQGHANGGSAMEQVCGITSACLAPAVTGAGRPLDLWRMQLMDSLKKRPEIRENFNDSGWGTVNVDGDANQLTPDQAAIFRTGFDLTAADLKGARQMLAIARVDDLGWIYVNGKLAGKTTDWSQAYSFDITRFLRPGHNVIAIAVQNQAAEGGISKPVLVEESGGADVPVQSFGRSEGNEHQWWAPELVTAGWKQVAIGETTTTPQDDSLLAWYRMNFALPSPRADVWVPWRVHLTGTGNGFLYLNGHAIGRYWEAGPQHDFFLPECWLKFGNGQTNNLTLSLRPVKGHAAIQTATVEPYFEFAEKR